MGIERETTTASERARSAPGPEVSSGSPRDDLGVAQLRRGTPFACGGGGAAAGGDKMRAIADGFDPRAATVAASTASFGGATLGGVLLREVHSNGCVGCVRTPSFHR